MTPDDAARVTKLTKDIEVLTVHLALLHDEENTTQKLPYPIHQAKMIPTYYLRPEQLAQAIDFIESMLQGNLAAFEAELASL